MRAARDCRCLPSNSCSPCATRGCCARSADGRRIEADLDARAEVATLRDVILRRVDLLPSGRQTLLKVASVLGRSFDPALLGSIHPDAPDPARIGSGACGARRRRTAGAARSAACLPPHPHPGGGVRTVAVRSAAVLHRAAAAAIEAAHGADLAPYHAQLAAHWERAAEPARGAAYRLRAAARALDAFANVEVVAQLSAIERAGGNETLLPARSDRAEFARLWGAAAQELSSFDDARHWLIRCAALNDLPLRQGKASTLAGIGIEVIRQLRLRAGVLRSRRDAAADARDALSAFVHIRLAERAYHDGDSLTLLHDTLVALNRAEMGGNSRDLVGATGGLALGLGVAGVPETCAILSTPRFRDRGRQPAVGPGDRDPAWRGAQFASGRLAIDGVDGGAGRGDLRRYRRAGPLRDLRERCSFCAHRCRRPLRRQALSRRPRRIRGGRRQPAHRRMGAGGASADRSDGLARRRGRSSGLPRCAKSSAVGRREGARTRTAGGGRARGRKPRACRGGG